VEFVLVLDTHRQSKQSVAELRRTICRYESKVLEAHPETGDQAGSEE
jgi:hypothetical protein